MTDEERVRLHGIKKQVKAAEDYGHFPCLLRWDTNFLLELAARCDAAEAALRGMYDSEGARVLPEERAAVLAGYDARPCPQCGERRTVSAERVWECRGCGARWKT